MNRIITARFEAGKRGIIAGAGCTGDNGPWVVPGDRCHHVLTPKEGVEYSVEIVGQTKQGNLRFGRIVSTVALVRSVEREAAQLIRAQGVGTETTAFRRGTIRIVATSRRDYDHVDVTLHVEIVEFPGLLHRGGGQKRPHHRGSGPGGGKRSATHRVGDGVPAA